MQPRSIQKPVDYYGKIHPFVPFCRNDNIHHWILRTSNYLYASFCVVPSRVPRKPLSERNFRVRFMAYITMAAIILFPLLGFARTFFWVILPGYKAQKHSEEKPLIAISSRSNN